jgi:purine-binding chemotaxis protein CheW
VRKIAEAVPQAQIVVFRLGDEEFGVDVFSVLEILRHQQVTPVPKAPAFVEGVIDVRGTLIPVVDLRKRFELDQAPLDGQTRIVVTQFGGERLGLVVDAVSEVLRVAESAISDPPEYVRGLAAEYVRGMVRLEDRLVVLLEVDRILSSKERIALEKTELGAAAEAAPGGQRRPATKKG